MEKNKLPQFFEIWNNDKVALIDPENKVCLGVTRRIAEHLEETEVQEKIYPIWEQQSQLQEKIEKSHEKINTAYLMVTRQCNMNCDFCAINANKKVNLEKEFKLADIKEKVIPFFKQCCPHKLIVTGGEPLVKDKIIEIVKLLHDGVKCPIILQSNGLIIDEDIVDGLRGNIKEIDFSTKHMFENPEKEAALRKHILMCLNAGITVVLSFIYEKTNKIDLFKVIDIAAEYKIGLLVNIVSPVGRAKENSTILSDLDKIEMNLDIAKYIYDKHYEDKPLFSVTQQLIQVRDSCGAYGKVMAIFPEGNVYMCQCLENDTYKMGNILVDSVEQINEKLLTLLQQRDIKESFRVREKTICNECEYRYLCGGKCPVSSDEDNYTCYFIKRMIDYQLFYQNLSDSRRTILGTYIQYLEHIRDNCPMS